MRALRDMRMGRLGRMDLVVADRERELPEASWGWEASESN